jgi:hypothetical protein
VCEHPFADGTPRGQRPELVIDRSGTPVGKERRQRIDEIESTGAGAPERVLDIRKFRLEEQTQAGHEVVRLAELRDARAFPLLPGRVG